MSVLTILFFLGIGNTSHAKQSIKKIGNDWVELKNCELSQTKSNDGDSFHATHMDKEYVLRLYLIDTPETDLSQIERNVEQMKDFDSSLERLLSSGKLASDVTKKALAQPFTVITKGEDAMGRSQIDRTYAFIKTADGTDLAEILLSHGLARSHGKETQLPTSKTNLKQKYDKIESKAKREKVGIWGKKEIKLPKETLVTNGDVLRAQEDAKKVQESKQEEINDIANYLGDLENKAPKNKTKKLPQKSSTEMNNNQMEGAELPRTNSIPKPRYSQPKVIQKNDSIFYNTIDPAKEGAR